MGGPYSRRGCGQRRPKARPMRRLFRLLAKDAGRRAARSTLVAGATRAHQAPRHRGRRRTLSRRWRKSSRSAKHVRQAETDMTATHHRRQGDRGGAARQGRGCREASGARSRHRAGPRRRAGRQQSGERSLCRQSRSKAVEEAACTRSITGCPPTVSEAELLEADRTAQYRPERAWHSGAVAAAEADRRPEDAGCDRSRARTSTASIRSMPGGSPPACRRWCRARRSAA